MNELRIVAAGRDVPDASDRIRRYCGLPWSGGPPETWAWHYYDAVPTHEDDVVSAVDVVCTAALHPGLSRQDLAWFHDHDGDLADWISRISPGTELSELAPDEVEHVASLVEDLPGPSVALASKVLHRKRPRAIPLLDRHILDWYRPLTRQRASTHAWRPLVEQLRDDQASAASTSTDQHLQQLNAELRRMEIGGRLTWLRALDIAIWMGSR